MGGLIRKCTKSWKQGNRSGLNSNSSHSVRNTIDESISQSQIRQRSSIQLKEPISISQSNDSHHEDLELGENLNQNSSFLSQQIDNRNHQNFTDEEEKLGLVGLNTIYEEDKSEDFENQFFQDSPIFGVDEDDAEEMEQGYDTCVLPLLNQVNIRDVKTTNSFQSFSTTGRRRISQSKSHDNLIGQNPRTSLIAQRQFSQNSNSPFFESFILRMNEIHDQSENSNQSKEEIRNYVSSIQRLRHTIDQRVQQEQLENGSFHLPTLDDIDELLKTLTISKFESSEKFKLCCKECSICMDEYQEGDEMRSLQCIHYFHKKCIDKWLKTSKKCPLCNHKQTLNQPDENLDN